MIDIRKYFVLFFVIVMTNLCLNNSANALPYKTCLTPKQSSACLIAYEKIKTLINPITKKKFFDDGVHIDNKKIFMYPVLHVATPDIDGDGKLELIVSIPEKSEEIQGLYCQSNQICPHFIIQDRTLPGQKRKVSSYKAIGPIYSFALALSTDESFDNYKSLRSYYDSSWQRFDVYQYDTKTDNYYNMSEVP